MLLKVAATAAGLLALAATQQTFRSGVSLVDVYVTVTDRAGRLVPDLTQADFEIKDNGKAQPIRLFEARTQAITIAVMVDESPSLFDVAGRVRLAVGEFAGRLLPADRATVGAFSHLVRLNPRLTNDAAELAARLDRGRVQFPAGTAMWDAIHDAAAALAGEGGRRVVLVLTDADDNCSEVDPRAVRERIARDGTMIYAIGVRGDSGLDGRDLRNLARETGGYYFELKPEDDLAATFARVADELHRQYLIAFSPSVRDGKSHEIGVRLKRSGLTARARRAYIAPGTGGGS